MVTMSRHRRALVLTLVLFPLHSQIAARPPGRGTPSADRKFQTYNSTSDNARAIRRGFFVSSHVDTYVLAEFDFDGGSLPAHNRFQKRDDRIEVSRCQELRTPPVRVLTEVHDQPHLGECPGNRRDRSVGKSLVGGVHPFFRRLVQRRVLIGGRWD